MRETSKFVYNMVSTRYILRWHEDGKEQSTWFLDLEDAQRSRRRKVRDGKIVQLIKRVEQAVMED